MDFLPPGPATNRDIGWCGVSRTLGPFPADELDYISLQSTTSTPMDRAVPARLFMQVSMDPALVS
jgi:hypothetical protein